MRNDIKDTNSFFLKKKINKEENSKNSKSSEKSFKKKSTLFDILQKRSIERTLSASSDKDTINNNLSNSINKNFSNIEINKSNRLKINNKKMIPYSFSIRNKILRNQTDNNLSINSFKQKTQNTLDTKDNFKKNEKIKRIIYQKNIGKTSTGLNEVINKEKNNHIYKSVISVNNIKNFTLYDREKENQIPNKIKFKMKNKEEIETLNNDNITINKNNIRYKILGKDNIDEIEKNDKTQIPTILFRKSFNKFSSPNLNKISDIKNNQNNNIIEKNNNNNINKILYHSIYTIEKNEKIKYRKYNTKYIKTIFENKIEIKNKNNYSKTIDNSDGNRKLEYAKSTFQLSGIKEFDTLDKKKSKTISKRRYYQNLTKNSKEKDNKNKDIYISNFINNFNIPLNTSKSNINLDTNSVISNKLTENFYRNLDKGMNIINTNSNTNYNTNNDKTNNIKDNDNDSQANYDFIDSENDKNIISDSRINSIINNEIENKNLLYNPLKIEEIIQNCSIPQFEVNDYIYQKSIGEGAYGTIFEVEEIKTGNKYAIKKIICKDIQELIKQKEQLELAYSIEHENIMKIYKVQIKPLDFSTYSINVLMELAKSDWNLEILKRAKDNNYYKEEELINIFKQLINGLLFLKNKNIGHRDIKPQNILIFPKNIFKLADLGEAKNIRDLESLLTLKGCELYMSPSLYWGLFHGKKNLVHNIYKSDIFSLGYCFLYAITLNINILEKIRRLNNNNDIRNIIFNSINKNIYSDNFLNIICKMIDINEGQRYDFEEVFDEIEKLSNCL